MKATVVLIAHVEIDELVSAAQLELLRTNKLSNFVAEITDIDSLRQQLSGITLHKLFGDSTPEFCVYLVPPLDETRKALVAGMVGDTVVSVATCGVDDKSTIQHRCNICGGRVSFDGTPPDPTKQPGPGRPPCSSR